MSGYTSAKEIREQQRRSRQRGDTYFGERWILRVKFSPVFDHFVAAVAQRLKRRLHYRSDGGRSARGKVRASPSFRLVYNDSLIKRYNEGDPIQIIATLNRRNDRNPNRRWVMSIDFAIRVDDVEGDSGTSKSAKDLAQEIIDEAQDIAAKIQGDKGKRIRAYLDLAEEVGYPKMLDLWYYNPEFVREFGLASSAEQAKMIKSGGGRFPLEGTYKDGWPRGLDFRNYPIKEFLESHGGLKRHRDKMRTPLGAWDEKIKDSLYQVKNPGGRQQEGGDLTKIEKEFRNHIKGLYKSKKHLYYHFDKNTKDDRSIFEF